jgi:putative ABC transport system permease protein
LTATLDRPVEAPPGRPRRAGPARRAVVRWSWRLFRREWRQQVLVLALVAVAVAATLFGLGAATHASSPSWTAVTLPGSDPQLAGDVAAIRQRVDGVDVVQHQSMPIPGTVATVDLRSESPEGQVRAPYRIVAGRRPTGSGEVALTRGSASLLRLSLGDSWTVGGQARRVVGLVENPNDLHDEFALVAPGQVPAPDGTIVFVDGPTAGLHDLQLPSGASAGTESETFGSGAVAGVLALGTLSLLFVGLVAAAGFVVMAQRRQRALGMLQAMGATDRHVRLVVLANGAAVGAVGAGVGAVVGLFVWLAVAPRFETLVAHRFDRFDLPWVAIGVAVVLAVVCAVAAAWWPARAAARTSIVGALSGRRPRPRPAHRFAAVGLAVMAAGVALLAFAKPSSTATDPNPLRVIGGTLAVTIGMLLLAPLAIAALAAVGRRWPVAIRLPLRDLARYQSRSAAALAAVTLALGIAATVTVSAAADAALQAPTLPNLPANQMLVYLGMHGHDGAESVPDESAAQLQSARSTVDAIANTLHSTATASLDAAVDKSQNEQTGPGGQGRQPAMLYHVTMGSFGPHRQGFSAQPVADLYVATPEVLAHYGIDPASLGRSADVLTSRTDLATAKIISGGPDDPVSPRMETVAALPRDTSGPSALLTQAALDRLGLSSVPAGWLVDARRPLTSAQIAAARRLAAAAGLTIETTTAAPSGAQLGGEATVVGMAFALGVLAMTVGLIRSETAGDLRTLTATGASSRTRRTIAAATAGALAVLGAVLGIAGAYAALVAWNRRDLHPLTSVPLLDVALLLVGLPLVAATAAWLLAGREPATITRQPE